MSIRNQTPGPGSMEHAIDKAVWGQTPGSEQGETRMVCHATEWIIKIL